MSGKRRRIGAEQDLGDAQKGLAVAGEKSAGVEGRREIVRALEADPAMGRPDAEQAAMARRPAHRAARIGAEREVAEAVRHRRGGAATTSRPGCGRARRRSPGVPKWAFLPFSE